MVNNENTRINRVTNLRQRAEHALRHGRNEGQAQHSPAVENLLYDLQVYQLELEAQNEELRQTQAKLRVSNEHYTELYDCAPVGYMTISVTGQIEQGNLTIASLLGLPRAKLLYQPLTQFVVREDQELLYHHQRRLFAEPQILHRVELRLTRGATTSFYAQLESRAILLNESQVIGYRTTVSDISERKQHEAALTVNHQNLVNRLEQLEATQQTLVQQERLAAVGNLAAGIAHDFNNTLTIISNYTALLLLPTTLGASVRKKLNIIKEQSEFATQLVQQLLDFSRQSPAESQSVELRNLLGNTVESLAQSLPTTIQLTLQTGAEAYFTSGNFIQLQQVLINLVYNARDAMPGGGTIAIDLTYQDRPTKMCAHATADDSHTWARINITDSGTGITPELLPHIFEPFFTTKTARGSGLGLAQAYGIIQQHGGEIEVATAVGQGTTFTLYLPGCCRRPMPEPGMPEDLPDSRAELLSPGHGETILIVDDNAPLRDALAELLEMMGYQVLSCADGATAIALYRQRGAEIALVLTDLSMPQMNGLELSNTLYAINPAVKIIISTGYLPDSIAKMPTDHRTLIWLPKPIDIDLLRKTLVELIDGS